MTAGCNTKLRRAYQDAVPIILLRKIATGVYVPYFPVYVGRYAECGRLACLLTVGLRALARIAATGSPVCRTPVRHGDHDDEQDVITDCVEDSESANPQAPPISAA